MPDSVELPSAPRPAPRSTAWRWSLAAAALAGLAAVAFDQWYTATLRREARVEVARQLGPMVSALQTAVDRRVTLVQGLRSFAMAQPTRERLDAEFPTFARGLLLSVLGVRALQFVEDGFIVATWPLEGNERALGYNLLGDSRPEIPRDVRRAEQSDSLVITGPIALVQGGSGLLVRRRIPPREGFPDLAAIILDVPTVVAAAGIPDRRTGLFVEVRDRSGTWFGGDTLAADAAPEEVSVRVPDGSWSLRAAPVGGWDALIAPRRTPARVALGFGVLAAAALGALFGMRQARLRGALADRTARLGVALKAGRMGTWELDVVQDRLHFDDNGAAILGRRVADLDGPMETLFHILHPQDAAFVARVFLEILQSDRHEYTLEHRVLLPDGTERWVLVLGEIERDAAGQAVRAHGIISDASDRRAIEARARQLDRVETIGSMAGGVAHDFNNLLAAIMSFTELAKEGLDAPGVSARTDAVHADLDEVMKVAQRARGLTAQLLAFSRGTTSEPRRADLGRTVQEMEPLLRRLLGQRITLRVDVALGVPAVWIDPSQFTQVVLNLVVNARDAIVERGEVRVALRRLTAAEDRPTGAPTGEWVLLEVRDTGSGMSEEVRRRIFEPYFTTKGKTRGTGLGLSVVHGVVRAAGGHALVESLEGAGSTFWIFLPPTDGPPARVTPSAGTARGRASGERAALA